MATINQWEINWLDSNDEQWMPWQAVALVALHIFYTKSRSYHFMAQARDYFFPAKDRNYFFITDEK